jgi:hypothetical protein
MEILTHLSATAISALKASDRKPPYISAGGGNGGSGGASGPGPCTSSQYSFSEANGWTINMEKSQAENKIPFRAFAYVQFCNGKNYGSCWSGETDFSFSFKVVDMSNIGAYVKLLFWTDSGNILGLIPAQHPRGEGKFRLVTFPRDDYPNQWGDEAEVQDNVWYRIAIKFKPDGNGVTVVLSDAQGAQLLASSGTIPVNMLGANNGPQLGIYSFDFGKKWPVDSVKLSLRDPCVGVATCGGGSALLQ